MSIFLLILFMGKGRYFQPEYATVLIMANHPLSLMVFSVFDTVCLLLTRTPSHDIIYIRIDGNLPEMLQGGAQ
jgi:hypothetical protein